MSALCVQLASLGLMPKLEQCIETLLYVPASFIFVAVFLAIVVGCMLPQKSGFLEKLALL